MTEDQIERYTSVLVRMSTHASIHARFANPDEGHVAVGVEPDRPRGDERIDIDTGAEYRALGGTDHRYSTDLNVGPSYPKTGFLMAKDPEGDPLDHDAIRDVLRAVGLGRFAGDATTEVILPDGYDRGEMQWRHALMVRPPGRATTLIRAAERTLDRIDDATVYATRSTVEAVV